MYQCIRRPKVKPRLFPAIIICLLLISLCPSRAVAEDCCVPNGYTTGYGDHTWSCIVYGEEYECFGRCPYRHYKYDCIPPPCNGDYEVKLHEWYGPCQSADFLCDGAYAICALTIDTRYIWCYFTCQDH